MGVLGIDRFSTNSLTSTVLVHYDPQRADESAGDRDPRRRAGWRRAAGGARQARHALAGLYGVASPGGDGPVRGRAALAGGGGLVRVHVDPDAQRGEARVRRGKEDRRGRARRRRDGRLPGDHVDLPGGRLLLVSQLRPVSREEVARQLAEAARERARQATEICLALPRRDRGPGAGRQAREGRRHRRPHRRGRPGRRARGRRDGARRSARPDRRVDAGRKGNRRPGFCLDAAGGRRDQGHGRDVGERDGFGQDRPDLERYGRLQDVVAAQGGAAGRQGRAADPGRRCARMGHDGAHGRGRGAQ